MRKTITSSLAAAALTLALALAPAAAFAVEGDQTASPDASSAPVAAVDNLSADEEAEPEAEAAGDAASQTAEGAQGDALAVNASGKVAVYRLYNEGLGGMHHYTMSQNEYNVLPSYGWDQEKVAFYALDETTSGSVLANATVDGVSLDSADISGKHYLFLPSTADMSAVELSFTLDGKDVQSVTATNTAKGKSAKLASGDSVNLASLGYDGSENSITLWLRAGDTFVESELTIMKSANITTVYVISQDESKGRAYVDASKDHSNKANVTTVVVSPDGDVRYSTADGKSDTIKGRGNSTWGNTDKNPYQIKLNKKTDLLGTGDDDNKSKTWILLANAFDATLIHNSIALNLGLELGLSTTPESTPVDFYYDGEYRGSYLLTEKCEIGSGRVEGNDLDDANEAANPGVDFDSLPVKQAVNSYGYTYQYVEGLASPSDYSGAYLLEEDGGSKVQSEEKSWFKVDDTSFGVYVVKSPEYATKDEALYITELFGEAMTCLENGGTNPATGKKTSDYFDIDSLARTYLALEVTKNPDAYVGSTYYYKPAGEEKFYAGPLWDFDCAFGVRVYGTSTSNAYAYNGLIGYNRGVASGLLGTSEFRQAVASLYESTVYPLVENIVLGSSTAKGSYLRSISSYVEELSASQALNEVEHGLVCYRNEEYLAEPFDSWETEIDYLKNFISNRADWLKAEIATWTDETVEIGNHDCYYGGVDYSLVFDYDYYVAKYGSEISDGRGGWDDWGGWDGQDGQGGTVDFDTAFNHFLTTGMAAGYQGCATFNVATYMANNPQLKLSGDLSAYYKHYCTTGFASGLKAF